MQVVHLFSPLLACVLIIVSYLSRRSSSFSIRRNCCTIKHRYLGKVKLQAKAKNEVFFCESCGTEHIKWMGRCSACKEWNTIKPFRQAKIASTSLDPRSFAAHPLISPSSTNSGTSLQRSSSGFQSHKWIMNNNDISSSFLTPMNTISEMGNMERVRLFSEEMNRVLGGGLVKGSVVLLAGEPGVGKSTLLLQLASTLSANGSVVYISGEENPQQIVLRANRLDLSQENIFLICDVDIDKALLSIAALPTEERPKLIIIDSIQTMRTADSTHTLGSVAQIRDSTAKVIQFAKSTGIAVILVGHVTKSGDVAGPRVLEHMVDTVLCIEGSEKSDYRMLRCDKNRFGSVSEVGVFVMAEDGMQDVLNPSEMFITQDVLQKPQEGSAVMIVMEGSRPILAEIQCLVSRTYTGTSTNGGQSVRVNAKRTADGFPLQRMLLICAVMEKRLQLSMWNRDIYLNVVGGLRIQEPSADLAVAAAIASSYLTVPIKPGTAFIGEIGLGGELRGGKRLEQRISEAVKLGFRRIIIPHSSGFRNVTTHTTGNRKKSGLASQSQQQSIQYSGVDIIPCSTLWDALVACLQDDNVTDILKAGKRKKLSTPMYEYSKGAEHFVEDRFEGNDSENIDESELHSADKGYY